MSGPERPSQETQPKTDAEPVLIPVPKRSDVFRDFAKVSKPKPSNSNDEE